MTKIGLRVTEMALAAVGFLVLFHALDIVLGQVASRIAILQIAAGRW